MKDMARPRNTVVRNVEFDMNVLLETISKKTDNELAAWFRKAVHDCTNGCTAQDVDPFIKESYKASFAKMIARQNIDAQKYKNKLAREGKFNGDAATSDGTEAITSRESGSLELTTISNISQDAPNGNAGDANLVHPAPIAESARCATSEAVKTLADGDFREDSLNVPDGSDAAQTESSTSAKILKLETEGQQSQLTGGAPERCKRSTASHAEKLPVSTPADSSEEKKPYGTCKHVMLTDAEGRHLREVYGNNLSVAIDILDAYIENGGKAAKKYKNHAAVLRKGNWVYEKVQTMALNEKRIENASKGLKNWKAEERERTARVLRGESADGKNYVRDEELSPAELEAKYA